MKKKSLRMTAALLAVITGLVGCGTAPSGTGENVGDTGNTRTAESGGTPTEEKPVSGEYPICYDPAPISGAIEINTASLMSSTTDLVDNVSALYPGENVMLSGLSLNFALAMLSNGADKEALTALENYLGMDVETANAYYAEFMKREKSDTKNKLMISNAFWTNEQEPFKIRKEYTKTLKDTYLAKVEAIPMNEKGIKKVNKWADKATDGLIKKALSPNDLTADTQCIIMNALLFDGKWQSPFEADRTKDVEFTLADGTVKTVKGMHNEEYFYYENEYATGFRKEYQKGEYYMIAILPKTEGDFNLADLDVEGFIASGKSTSELNADLNIMLPKTDFEMKYDLTDLLKNAGLAQIFDANSNNFPGIFDTEDSNFRSYVSKIIQNDRLIIDEDGTKAAAVTSIMVDGCMAAFEEKQKLQVYLNRPFALLLMDGATDEPLFVAKIMNP